MEAPLLVLLLLLAVCQLGVNGSSVPRFLPASGANKYIYATRAAAAAACANASHVASAPAMVLCKASQLTNHSMCEAGWLADGEGYWMAKATAGRGGAGFSSWSGPAGAYCCPPPPPPPPPGTPGKPRIVGWCD